jgi:FkbM family methyltransferase
MKPIKQLIKFCIHLPGKVLASAFFLYEKLVNKVSAQFGLMRQNLIDVIDNDIREVCHQNPNEQIRFKLYTPNTICAFRYNTFSSKEPEMLEWIDEYGGDGTFYDIGANIGIYSLYYAKSKTGSVYSFEPSVFNLRQLAKNISINNMSDRITILSNPLSNITGVATFMNGNTDEGGALSAFGVNYGYDGKLINDEIKYTVLGFSLDDLLKNGLISKAPSLIKIDVDGIEHLILTGAKNTLANDSLKSIFIEVNDDFEEQYVGTKRLLESAGFTLKEKRQSDINKGNPKFGSTYNQIWIR